MRDLFDVHGASGAVYRFGLVRDGRPLSPIGGNYLYVRELEDGYEIVHVGEGQNLINDSQAHWNEANATHGPLHLFTRLNIGEAARQHEQQDILEGLAAARRAAGGE